MDQEQIQALITVAKMGGTTLTGMLTMWLMMVKGFGFERPGQGGAIDQRTNDPGILAVLNRMTDVLDRIEHTQEKLVESITKSNIVSDEYRLGLNRILGEYKDTLSEILKNLNIQTGINIERGRHGN